MSLIETFRHHSRMLSAKSAASEAIHHLGNRGTERESILEEFLRPLLPERFQIGQGEIRATNGRWSRQEDLILYDRLNCPRLFVGGKSQIFPIESVGGVIEVKTRLSTKEIGEATRNLAEARALEKIGDATHISGGAITFGSPTPTLGCLFAYELALKPETFMEKWVEAQLAIPPQHRINLVCILNQFTVVYIDQTFHLWDKISDDLLDSVCFFESGEDTLLTFTLCLSRALAEARFGIPDLFKYVFSEGASVNFPYKYFKRS